MAVAVPMPLMYSGENPRINEKEPHFTVLQENRKLNTCHMVHVEYQ